MAQTAKKAWKRSPALTCGRGRGRALHVDPRHRADQCGDAGDIRPRFGPAGRLRPGGSGCPSLCGRISTTAGLGSGVVYDSKGDIVTNAHVVGTETTFTVTLSNGQSSPGHLVGLYAPDDLAVIKVTSTKGLNPVTSRESASLEVGDIVLAIGNPLGLSSSVTDGIVSFNGHGLSEGNGVFLPNLIQTSATINPGNSGGALVNISGQVSAYRPWARQMGRPPRLVSVLPSQPPPCRSLPRS